MRKKIVAGNWKMNLSIADGASLAAQVIDAIPALQAHQHIVFCTPFTHLERVSAVVNRQANANLHLGAQNCHPMASGAYTGEIAIPMLTELGVDTVIIGHSERRQYFNETSEFLKQKVDALVSAGLHVLFCCGEPLQVREQQAHNAYVAAQLEESLFHLSEDQLRASITIAYEPIWAIGTGVTATTQQAQEMHAHIRSLLAARYGQALAGHISILYGGSCNASNAKELFACADVDGGLIGGAALKADTFLPIIEAMA